MTRARHEEVHTREFFYVCPSPRHSRDSKEGLAALSSNGSNPHLTNIDAHSRRRRGNALARRPPSFTLSRRLCSALAAASRRRAWFCRRVAASSRWRSSSASFHSSRSELRRTLHSATAARCRCALCTATAAASRASCARFSSRRVASAPLVEHRRACVCKISAARLRSAAARQFRELVVKGGNPDKIRATSSLNVRRAFLA